MHLKKEDCVENLLLFGKFQPECVGNIYGE